MDYQVEFVFRGITREEAIKVALEMHDHIFLNGLVPEFEFFVMEAEGKAEGTTLTDVYHWPKNATGIFDEKED